MRTSLSTLILATVALGALVGCSSTSTTTTTTEAVAATRPGQEPFAGPEVARATPPRVLAQAVISRAETPTGSDEPRMSKAGNVLLAGNDGLEYELALVNGVMPMFDTTAASVKALAAGQRELGLTLAAGKDIAAKWKTLLTECSTKAARCVTGDIAFIVDGVVIATATATEAMSAGAVLLTAADAAVATKWAALFRDIK